MRGVVLVTVIGEAFVRIRPDDAGFSGEAEKGILSKVGGIASKAAGVFAAGFAIKQGADFFGGLVKDASESRRVLAETEQAIKATGGAAKVTASQVSDMSESLSRQTGIDDELIQTGANLLLTFKNIRNETGKGNDVFNQANQAVLDLSKQFGGVEGSAVQVGKALNDPIAGITALGRAGITFSDAQKKTIETLVDTGDVLGAQKIILGEINAQVGGQAAAQATAIDKLKVTYGNLREELGARLLPIVDKVATFLADRLPGALDAAGRVVGPVIAKISNAVRGLFDLFVKGDFTGALRKAFNVEEDSSAVAFLFRIRDAVIGLFAFITKGDFTGAFRRAFNVEEDSPIVNVLFRVREAFFNLVSFVRENVQPILIAVGAAFLIAAGPVVAIGAALVLLYTRFESVRTVIGAVAEFLTGTVVPAIAAFVGFVSEQFSNLADFVRENWAGIREAISHVIVVVQGIIENFVSVVQAIWRAWGDELLNIVSIVWDQIQNVIDTAVGIISGLITAGLALINGEWGAAWDAIKGILSTAWDFIVETVTNALRIAREVVEGGVSAIVAVVGDIPGQILGALGDLGGLLYDAGRAAISGLLQGIKDGVGAVYDFVSGIAGKIADLKGPIEKDKRLLIPAGVAIMRGLEQGIASQQRALEDRLRGITSTIAGVGNVGGLSAGAGAATGGSTALSITGPLVVVQGSIAPGQESSIGAAVRQAVTQLVADGTVGRAMSKRRETYSTR